MLDPNWFTLRYTGDSVHHPRGKAVIVNRWCALLLTLSLFALTGCNLDFSTRSDGRSGSSGVISEGVVYSVTFQQADGKPTTITRSSVPPQGNGTWNIDAYGKLTPEALVLTYPGRRDLGPHVIPFDRIVDIQFGDGGISHPGAVNHDHEDHAAHEHAH